VSDVDNEIRNYLLNHPELIRELQNKLQAQEAEARAKAMKVALAEVRNGLVAATGEAVAGGADADVTIVEFYDVECPFCKALAPDLERLIKEDTHVKIVFREFPILGAGSTSAAKAEIASQNQGRFEAFHNALMADKTPEHSLDEKHIFDIAKSTGLDVEKLKADIAAPTVDQRIAANREVAAKLSITGTPGLLFIGKNPVNDSVVPGILTFDALKAKIAEVRQIALNSQK